MQSKTKAKLKHSFLVCFNHNNTIHNNTAAAFGLGHNPTQTQKLHVLVRLTIKKVFLSLLLSLQSFVFATQFRALQSL